MAVFDVNGTSKKCIKAIAHRGYCTTAPENTIPAYELAAANGFKYVETDISPTSDGVMMLLHDATIDRTSNGSGTLSQMTYEQVRQYDFGSWKSADYAGTVIPTLEEFLQCCVTHSLHPYIEFKTGGDYSDSAVRGVVDMVEDYGMKGNVTYISFALSFLTIVKNYDNEARVGYLWRNEEVTNAGISAVQSLMTGHNCAFLDANIRTDTSIAMCRAAGIPLEYWTVTDVTTASVYNNYVSGVTGNSGQPASLNSVLQCRNVNGNVIDGAYTYNGSLL